MRILVATDGSNEAVQALDWLTYFPLPEDSTVEVVSSVWYPELADNVRQALRTYALCTTVDGARERLAKRWATVTARVADGDPREVIVTAAAKGAADLIVLGARGLGAAGTLLPGRVSIAVARHAPCPVLVCKGAARAIRSVTVALDGSTESQAAFAYFGRLPLPRDLSVGFVGVVEPIRYPATAPETLTASVATATKDYEGERRRALEHVLAAAANDIRERVARTVSVTPVGSPATCILREAEREASDLIVVGARRDLRSIPLGSVSETVLCSAPCPVLIVRRER